MTRQTIIERTIKAINQLPEDKARNSDLADFVVKKFKDNRTTESIQQFPSIGHAFDFLNIEEDLYSSSDLPLLINMTFDAEPKSNKDFDDLV